MIHYIIVEGEEDAIAWVGEAVGEANLKMLIRQMLKDGEIDQGTQLRILIVKDELDVNIVPRSVRVDIEGKNGRPGMSVEE
jgi:hypothetical protein